MTEHSAETRATFTRMDESTYEDWQIVSKGSEKFASQLSQRVLDHLRLLAGNFDGFPVDRLEHCLQTATRAHRDGRDEEYVVCALIHDIGDVLGCYNHADLAAEILRPFVSDENYWMIKHHGIFQGYYFFEYLGLDKNKREQFRDNPWFDYTAEFCALYDQVAFDPEYDSLPLAFFEPMVHRVFAEPKRVIYAE